MPTSTAEQYPLLISFAVHEIMTPAAIVSGYLRMLHGDLDLNDRQRKMVEAAERSCARMIAIVRELRDVAKLDSGEIALARQPLDLFTLAADVAEHVQEGKERGVTFAVRGTASGAPIVGDATRLRAALDAIFRAILREKPGPSSVIADRRLERHGSTASAVLVVAEEDSVAAAYDARCGVFNEYRGGLGLALPLAHRVIVGHGGAVWSAAEPEELAKGSIIIRLPVVESDR